MSKQEKRQLTDWQFKEAAADEWKKATVPGCVHTDLLDHGIIEDPFVGKKELDVQWIDKKDWEYQTTFDVSDKTLQEDRIELTFEGLDTYADVQLNGTTILKANNMFRIWKIDIKDQLQLGENTLHVYFHSPIQHDIDKPDQIGFNYPADNDHSEDGGVGEKKLSIFARKAPYHYGWDWGPRFVTSGIWKEVYIEAWSELKLQDVYLEQQEVTAKQATVMAKLEVETTNPQEVIINISDQYGWEHQQTVSVETGKQIVEVPFTKEAPKLWWTNGLGEAHLYQFTFEILSAEQQLLSDYQLTTGLRSLRFVREPDSYGESFYFELNGVPVFAKGANHIPNDSFQTSVTKERYLHEILTAVDSNMNMLRIWGGGIYEYDAFYEYCDQYGILVWQDFMFACSMYPGDEAFLANVKQEAIDQVKRLRNYASLALWCGNNEIDSAWAEYIEEAGWGWKQLYNADQRKQLWEDYEKLFHQLLPEVIEQYNPVTSYWPSSPIQNLSHTGSRHATNHTVTKGDMHYWDVWHGLKPLEAYKENVGRFMSEYGFQSFPEEKTLREYAKEEELELESDVMLHHQKNGSGNRLIKNYMEMYYKEPKDFLAFVHVSHILQADAIKQAVEGHRQHMPYCMGTLYWQMNDCWPVASWSGMDYFGRWKALQFVMKDRFKPTVLIADQTEEQLAIYAVSDVTEEQEAELVCTLYDFQGNVLDKTHKPVVIQANTSTKIAEEDLSAFEQIDWSNSVLHCELIKGEEQIDSIHHLFSKPKDIKLENTQITCTIVEGGIELEADSFALNVWLDTEQTGHFDDNNFSLIPGIKKFVPFRGSLDPQEQKSAVLHNVEITSMYDYITK
ncbi:beta-mannosidase [Gracilibacillus alcaliphilus]|uniref:beta-mannosidase n=1 Tax=Gracilibacillus alcaliphilus TaxID=1401441 RepID=UPI00195A18B7|nr:glycoside hydrolase family 2 protein [Gracilibacillus alcaliphilus]MBM7676295.1 beta-mannosidase [Gracilibacillus alcaliphilus]